MDGIVVYDSAIKQNYGGILMEDGIMRSLKESLTEGMEGLIKNRYVRSVLSTLFFMGFLLLSLEFSSEGPVATLKALAREAKEILNEDKSVKRSCMAILVVFISLLIILPFHNVCGILWGLAALMALLMILAIFVAVVIIIIASNDLDAEEACPLARKS